MVRVIGLLWSTFPMSLGDFFKHQPTSVAACILIVGIVQLFALWLVWLSCRLLFPTDHSTPNNVFELCSLTGAAIVHTTFRRLERAHNFPQKPRIRIFLALGIFCMLAGAPIVFWNLTFVDEAFLSLVWVCLLRYEFSIYALKT